MKVEEEQGVELEQVLDNQQKKDAELLRELFPNKNYEIWSPEVSAGGQELLLAALKTEQKELQLQPGEYPVWSPYDAVEAAVMLTELLKSSEDVPD